MVALHFTHDFTISSVVESTRRYANRPSAAESLTAPPTSRESGWSRLHSRHCPCPFLSFTYVTLSPFFSNPKIQTTESAHALLEHNFTDGSCTSHACRVGVGSGIKSNVGPLVYKACQLMSTPDRAESVP